MQTLHKHSVWDSPLLLWFIWCGRGPRLQYWEPRRSYRQRATSQPVLQFKVQVGFLSKSSSVRIPIMMLLILCATSEIHFSWTSFACETKGLRCTQKANWKQANTEPKQDHLPVWLLAAGTFWCHLLPPVTGVQWEWQQHAVYASRDAKLLAAKFLETHYFGTAIN